MHQLVIAVIHLDIEFIEPFCTWNLNATAVITAFVLRHVMMDGCSVVYDFPFTSTKDTGLKWKFKALRHQCIPRQLRRIDGCICDFVLCDCTITEFLSFHRLAPKHRAGQRVIIKRHLTIDLEREVTIGAFRVLAVHHKHDDIVLFRRTRPVRRYQCSFYRVVGDIGQKGIRIIRNRVRSGKQLIAIRSQIDKVSGELQLMCCRIQINSTCIGEWQAIGIELICPGPQVCAKRIIGFPFRIHSCI